MTDKDVAYKPGPRTWRVLFALIILALAAGGYGVVIWRTSVADRDLHARLLAQARAIARTIDAEQVKALSFSAADQERPEFQRLRAQLISYRSIVGCRGIYTMALRNGVLVFGPESYAEDDPQASPPGTVYQQPSQDDLGIFQSGRAVAGGPWRDEYGTFVSALAPVLDPRSNEVLMVVGLDIEVDAWQAALAQARRDAVLCVLLLAAVSLGGVALLWRRSRQTPERQARLRYAEVYINIALCLTLTLVVTLALHDEETRARRAAFQQLAEGQANLVLDAFRDLRDHQLAALARFYESSQFVERDEFRTFVAPLVRRGDIQALDWIRPVPAAHKQVAEAEARADGLSTFQIWQLGEAGQPEPVADRPVYYPVWYVEPLEGNEATLGYDLGSEPLRRAALEAALASGLPTASEPLTLVQEQEGQTGLVVLKPVYAGRPPTQTLRGFALAALRLEALLRSTLETRLSADAPAVVCLYALEGDLPPQFLASTVLDEHLRDTVHEHYEDIFAPGYNGLAAVYPLFAFGKAYALVAHASPAFLAANPARAGWLTPLVGLALTVAIAALTFSLRRQRVDLEDQVQARTAELRASEARYRTLVQASPDAIIHTDLQANILLVNSQTAALYGSAEEIVGRNTLEFFAPEERQRAIENMYKALETGLLRSIEYTLLRKDGSRYPGELSVSLIRNESGQPAGLVGVLRDITEHKQAEEALRTSEERYRAIVTASPLAIVTIDRDGYVQSWNAAAERIFGWAEQEALGRILPYVAEDQMEDFEALRQRVLDGEAFSQVERTRWRRNGAPIEVSLSAAPIRDSKGQVTAILAVAADITERKRAELERERLESQLIQAQKMEAVGRLAGGVAHDFNNLLTVILGNAELALGTLEPSNPSYADIQEIINAGRRAADLTRQLLAFARRQTIAPQVLDLNDVIAGMLKMLRRLIGENINLAWLPGLDLWSVKMDPTQVDQILANLLVNARDAIAGVGKVTIETNNVEIAEEYCQSHAEFIPGQYVVLAVSDNGCGMDHETLQRIFEPFFTTKPLGQGTGLGLATVYGIVRQNNGLINVYSEPGKGTTFRIYLPRHAAKGAVADKERARIAPPTGTETVLLVEDEEALLKMGERQLAQLGYTVLIATSPPQALEIAKHYPGYIDLLMTDVVMPDMSGRDLWQAVHALRPDIKCLFMSGYTANVIAHRGVLDQGVHFLQKPFSLEALAVKLREALSD